MAIRKSNEAAVAAFDKVNGEYIEFTREERTTGGGTEIVLYSADWIKWYPELDDIKAYAEVIKNDDWYDDIDFIRVGEGNDDVERQLGGDWLCTCTTIEVL